MEKWYAYLADKEFTLRVDNIALRWLKTYSTIACWCNNYSKVKNYTGWETEGTSLLLTLGEGTFLHFYPRLT